MLIIFMEGKEGKTIYARENEPRCYSKCVFANNYRYYHFHVVVEFDQLILRMRNRMELMDGKVL